MIDAKIKEFLVEKDFPSKDFSLSGLISGCGKYFRTLFAHDDGTFGCAGPQIFVGYVSGMKSPEDAVATMWLRLADNNFNVKVRKKAVRKPRKADEVKVDDGKSSE
jgi:hypothetical protein